MTIITRLQRDRRTLTINGFRQDGFGTVINGEGDRAIIKNGLSQPLSRFTQFCLDLVRQNSTFTCTSIRNVWGYVGDPSAANPPQLISVPANIPTIIGGRYVSAETKFYTTDSSGNTLCPYTLESTPNGVVRIFTAFKPWTASETVAVGDQRSARTSAGNRIYITCTTGGACDTTQPVITDANVAAGTTGIVDNVARWTVSGYATVEGQLQEDVATNYVPDSREFDAASWLPVSTPGRTANAIGIDGVTNSAYTVEDNSGAANEAITVLTTIANDSNTHIFSVYVKKDAITTRFPALRINMTGGVAVSAVIHLNTQTGATTEVTSSVATGFGVEDYPGWWRVWISATNNSSGNTSMFTYIYPADGSVFGTTAVAATGTIVVDQADVRCNQGHLDSPIITSGGTLTRALATLTEPTTGKISPTKWGIDCVFNPEGSGQTGFIFGSYVDADNGTYILTTATTVILRERVGGADTDITETYTHVAGSPMRVQAMHDGVKSYIRAWSIGSAVPDWHETAYTTASQIAATMQFGADGNSANQFDMAGLISFKTSTRPEDLGL